MFGRKLDKYTVECGVGAFKVEMKVLAFSREEAISNVKIRNRRESNFRVIAIDYS